MSGLIWFPNSRNNSPEEVTIEVKYLPKAQPLKQTDWGSWIDLYTYEEVTLKINEQRYINLGVSMKLPKGYEAILAPRSSTFKSWGLTQTNSFGVIDASFNGDNDIWMLPVHATKNVTIPAGTRLCQFRIQKEQPKINFKAVDSLGTEDRGGLGSSGV